MGFVCSVCGEFHAERLLDIRAGLPDPIFDLDDEERARRTWLADDFAVLDDARFFVRGLLEIPIPELDACFGYGTWVEVGEPEFEHLQERWTDPDQFGPVAGSLANELEPYAATAGLRAVLHARSVDKLPSVDLEDAPHELVADQRRGITAARSDLLAATVLHD